MSTVTRLPPLGPVLHARLRTEAPQIIRIVVAACVAWQLSAWIDPNAPSHPPVYAVVVPLVAMRDQPFSAFNVSFDRLLGVAGGVCLGVLTAQLLGLSVLSIAVVLSAGLLLGVALRLGPTLNIQAAASGLLVFANPDPDAYATIRLWETAFGVAVTVVLSPLLLPTNTRKAYERELVEIRNRIASLLVDCLDLLAATEVSPIRREHLQDRADQLDQRVRSLPTALAAAQRAVALNPLRRSDRTPLSALDAPTIAARPVGRAAAALATELSDLAPRPDLRHQWPAVRDRLGAVLNPLIAQLRSSDDLRSVFTWSTTGGGADGARAHDAFRAWQLGGDGPLDIVVRRRTRELLAQLDRDPAPCPRSRNEHRTTTEGRDRFSIGGEAASGNR